MDKKIRVGIIGCGGIANGKHMPSLAKLKHVEMVAFCDIIESKAAEAAKKFGTADAKVYTDYKPRVESAKEDFEFFDIMCDLVDILRGGHSQK